MIADSIHDMQKTVQPVNSLQKQFTIGAKTVYNWTRDEGGCSEGQPGNMYTGERSSIVLAWGQIIGVKSALSCQLSHASVAYVWDAAQKS